MILFTIFAPLTIEFFVCREEFVKNKSSGAGRTRARVAFFRVFRTTNVLFLRAPRRFFVGGRGSLRAVK